MIGSRWASITNTHGDRRLDEPGDWVSAEIQRALERRIRVIPVLISTTMPSAADIPATLHPLLQRQAIDISDRHWKRDIDALAEAFDRIPGITRRMSFRWKDYAHDSVQRTMTLTASEFLRRFVQHVLPRGFVRIRQFGFLANHYRTVCLAVVRRLLQHRRDRTSLPPPRTWTCPRCGGPMTIGPNLNGHQLTCTLAFDTS